MKSSVSRIFSIFFCLEFKWNEEALKFLRGVKEEIKVITIVGPSRSGKSTKLCNLIGRAGAFKIDHQTDGVTKGIWIWKGKT